MTTMQLTFNRWGDCFRIVFSIAFVVLAAQLSATAEEPAVEANSSLSAAMIAVSDASTTRLKELKSSGVNTVVFKLTTSDDEAKEAIRSATKDAENAEPFFRVLGRSRTLAGARR